VCVCSRERCGERKKKRKREIKKKRDRGGERGGVCVCVCLCFLTDFLAFSLHSLLLSRLTWKKETTKTDAKHGGIKTGIQDMFYSRRQSPKQFLCTFASSIFRFYMLLI
jgi:hypothetical protein